MQQGQPPMNHKNSSTNQNYQAKHRKHGQNIFHP